MASVTGPSNTHYYYSTVKKSTQTKKSEYIPFSSSFRKYLNKIKILWSEIKQKLMNFLDETCPEDRDYIELDDWTVPINTPYVEIYGKTFYL